MRRQPSKRKRLITGIIFITLSLLLSLSILSYNTTDYEPPVKSEDIKNLMGLGGAYVSYYLIKFTFGNAVLIPCLLLLLWGWRIIRHKPISWLRRFSLYSLSTMFLISLGLALISEFAVGGSPLSYEYSGLVGGFFASYSHMYLGKAGTVIVYCAFVFIVFVLWLHFPIWNVLGLIERLIGKIWRLRKAPMNGIKSIVSFFEQKRRKMKLKTSFRGDKTAAKGFDIPLIRKRETTPLEDAKTKAHGGIEPVSRGSAATTPSSLTISPQKDTALPEDAYMDEEELHTTGTYTFPSFDLLNDPPTGASGDSKEDIIRQAEILENTLLDFDVQTKVAEVHPGPVLTLYEIRPEVGVKISKILALQNDLALAMKAKGIRIIAPIPGKDTVGIEIPNRHQSVVYLKSLVTDPAFREAPSKLTIALGRTVTGEAYFADLAKMPHLLIAGSTGSGKSVGISTIITSILYNATPAEVTFIMIDPKMLELTMFNKLYGYHLLTADFIGEKVITKTHNAVMILRSCVFEMERRYNIMARTGVRNITDYNNKQDKPVDPDTGKKYPDTLEHIVVIIDELADLMMTASKDIEEPIARLAQMARAVGLHLVLATQRPSVDVITGVIKANFPARIAFQVATKVDSRTILDMNGAEQLLGSGDLLYLPPGAAKPIRIQNAFVSQNEIEKIVDSIASQSKFLKSTHLIQETDRSSKRNGGPGAGDRDPLFTEAARLVVIHQQGSISLLQRRLKVGYSRAARLIDELEDAGIVGAYDGSKARQVLIEEDELDDFL